LVSTKKKIHVVRRGETLHTIASRYGTTVKKVKKVNRIKSSQIRVGKRLQILPVNYRSGS
jgi:membrane-bound lytic murein transglycosylase D